MFTLEDEPWVLYLEIDEETFESKLRDDTPSDIREKYERHLADIEKIKNNNMGMPK